MTYLLLDSTDEKTIKSISSGEFKNLPDEYIQVSIEDENIPDDINETEYTYSDGVFTAIESDTLSDTITESVTAVATYLSELLEAGYAIDDEHHIELNDTTIARFEALWSSRDSLTYPFSWICRETDTTYDITDADDFNTIKLEMLSYMSTLIRVASSVKTTIRACESEDDVNIYLEAYLASDGVTTIAIEEASNES